MGKFGKPLYMKTLLCIVACLFSITVIAQTKLISFRSHSGNNANFRSALEHDLFDIHNSNFGLVEEHKIDSVIMDSKDKIIVIRRRYVNSYARDVWRDNLTIVNAGDVFSAADMPGLKKALRKRYRYASLESTLFIGFDKKFKKIVVVGN